MMSVLYADLVLPRIGNFRLRKVNRRTPLQATLPRCEQSCGFQAVAVFGNA
jgi:hypothetical protein